MTKTNSIKAHRRTALVAICALVAFAVPSIAWASRSQDLQNQINESASQAGQYESAASNAERNGDKQEACRLYRRASQSWQDAASAGTSLIVETLNDSNLDPDAVNENVHIMANNAAADDAQADSVC